MVLSLHEVSPPILGITNQELGCSVPPGSHIISVHLTWTYSCSKNNTGFKGTNLEQGKQGWFECWLTFLTFMGKTKIHAVAFSLQKA